MKFVVQTEFQLKPLEIALKPVHSTISDWAEYFRAYKFEEAESEVLRSQSPNLDQNP